jgi:hypothetical protein
MVITILKDWWLTAEEPNVLFYIFVPILSILGGVLSMVAAVRIFKLSKSITFLTMLAISLGANTIMQIVENIMKITYYLLWAYPGLLYILIVIPMGFVLMAFGLVRWGKVKIWKAMLLTIIDFVGSMIIGIILTDLIGLTTPGS